MSPDLDHYEVYYADKLWLLLPEIYRAQDSASFDRKGPLREMVDRIGAQAAILRRGIDRLWEDQSIETCDNWVIAYIGDLLATNLVSSLNARGQRIDVSKTIYYRRRKGTVALLEELASDVTGWDVRVVEFFRRLGRTRHNFDPEIGVPADSDDPPSARALQLAAGLVGPLTGSAIGGWADLRNPYGAAQAGRSAALPQAVGSMQGATAFDEFHHTADFRRGRGVTGWYNIPKLGVFIWRLVSFGLAQTTPVALAGCPGHFTFDPTGRLVPLFAASRHAFGDQWVSPAEWQLPTPISRALLEASLADPAARPLYATVSPSDGVTIVPNALGVFARVGVTDNLMSPSGLTIWPDLGRFKLKGAASPGTMLTSYHYGFASTIGAGPFDRRDQGAAPVPLPSPGNHVSGGGALPVPPADGSLVIDDSLTWNGVVDPPPIGQASIAAAPQVRPVIRTASPHAWTFTGRDESSVLVLDGLLVSGTDIVLAGSFADVVIHCCSLDPGEANADGAVDRVWAAAADGRDLLPTVVRVQGQVAQLTVRRSLLGPIRTEGAGLIETLKVTDSVVQAVDAVSAGDFAPANLVNPALLAASLRDGSDPLTVFLRGALSATAQAGLAALAPLDDPSSALVADAVAGLNAVVGGGLIYEPARFAGIRLSPLVLDYVTQALTGVWLARVNRMLLKQAYPAELLETGELAMAMREGLADLERSTVMGPAAVHKLHASEAILDDLTFVQNAQDGCVRFSATADGSVLPRRYESVTVAPGAPLFTSRQFGQPGYGQLSPAADGMIVDPAPGATILQGAENGSEMGAFARDLNPIKQRSLSVKYQEFMPIGLTPVLIYVT